MWFLTSAPFRTDHKVCLSIDQCSFKPGSLTRVTRRKQQQPGITPNDNTTHVPTAGSSAALTKPNQTPTRHPRAKAKQSYKRSHPTPHEADAHTYTRMRPHAPSHQVGDHPVPAHTERHNPSKVRTQRQPGLPPRAVSSQGQRHRFHGQGRVRGVEMRVEGAIRTHMCSTFFRRTWCCAHPLVHFTDLHAAERKQALEGLGPGTCGGQAA